MPQADDKPLVSAESGEHLASLDVSGELQELQAGVEASKTKEGIKTDLQSTIKETTKALGEYIKDPEKKKELITVMGIGVLVWLLKPVTHRFC